MHKAPSVGSILRQTEVCKWDLVLVGVDVFFGTTRASCGPLGVLGVFNIVTLCQLKLMWINCFWFLAKAWRVFLFHHSRLVPSLSSVGYRLPFFRWTRTRGRIHTRTSTRALSRTYKQINAHKHTQAHRALSLYLKRALSRTYKQINAHKHAGAPSLSFSPLINIYIEVSRPEWCISSMIHL